MRFLLMADFILLAIVADSQPNSRADAVQNYSRGIPSSTGATHKPSLPRPNWHVRYRSGSFQLKEGQWLRGAFVPEEIANETYKQIAPIFTVTLDQLRAIYLDSRAEKDSDLRQNMPRSACGYAKSLMPKGDSVPLTEAFIAWGSSPGPISRAVAHLSARRPVRLVWSDAGTEKEFVLTLNLCEYASFIANLRRFAGQRWQEISHELR